MKFNGENDYRLGVVMSYAVLCDYHKQVVDEGSASQGQIQAIADIVSMLRDEMGPYMPADDQQHDMPVCPSGRS